MQHHFKITLMPKNINQMQQMLRIRNILKNIKKTLDLCCIMVYYYKACHMR